VSSAECCVDLARIGLVHVESSVVWIVGQDVGMV